MNKKIFIYEQLDRGIENGRQGIVKFRTMTRLVSWKNTFDESMAQQQK
jgi:hypothetical protein